MAPSADAMALAAAHNNRGTELRRQGQAAEALVAFQQALALWPDNPDIIYNLANAHHDRGELEPAAAYYRQALHLQPPYAAEVSNSLATAFKEQGLLSEAGAQYRETLRLEPDHARAYFNLSELAASGHYQYTPDELKSLKAYLAGGRGTAFERSLCGFALASVLAQQGAYDQAFACYRQANELKRELLRERNQAFDAQAHAAMVDRLIAAAGRTFFERVKKWGTATELPIFIVGMPRSGSTLVEQILASHARVVGGGEIGDIRRFLTDGRSDHATSDVIQLVPNVRAARAAAAAYLRYLTDVGNRAERVTVKYLENYLHLGVIAALFTPARIIHCRREPLDVCLSCYFQNFQDMPFAWSLEDIGAYYRAYEKLMAHWDRSLPAPIHEVSYEELVHDQEAVTRKLLTYCGLEWDERCLTFFNTRRVVQTASSVQVRNPISPNAIGRWTHYRAHLEPLFKALGK